MTLADLASSWRDRAALFRDCGTEEAAATHERLAAELEDVLRSRADELLDPDQAAEASGYSKRRLRELVAEGSLPNHGEPGRPRYRRAELPRKASTKGPGFDARSHAAEVLG